MHILKPQPSTGRSHQQGFTLIEILVTVVVLAIGLLGLAGLQLTGLKYNHSAYQRSQATIISDDISDRMRANRSVALTGAYDIALGTTPPGSSCEGVGANCSAAAIAAADLSAWKQALSNTLPSGDGAITRNGNRMTITVQWDDTRGEQAAQTLTVETEL